MDTKQVNEALEKLFKTERMVFWNDPEREFVNYFSGALFSPVEGVKVNDANFGGLLAECEVICGTKDEY